MKDHKGHGHHDTHDGRSHEEHLRHVLHRRARGGAVRDEELEGVPLIGGHPEHEKDLTNESGRKRGGKVEKRDHRARGGRETEKERMEREREEKRKEEHKKRKRGGKVHGKHPGHRLDKRARGGRMTPKSPFSGADAPDLEYGKADVPSQPRGAGRERQWES